MLVEMSRFGVSRIDNLELFYLLMYYWLGKDYLCRDKLNGNFYLNCQTQPQV